MLPVNKSQVWGANKYKLQNASGAHITNPISADFFKDILGSIK